MSMHPVNNDNSEKSDHGSGSAGFDGGDGGDYDGSMRERVTRLEAFADEALRRFDRLELAVERIRQELTEFRIEMKQELSTSRAEWKQEMTGHRLDTKHDIDNAIKWIVGVMIAISMAAITIITFVLNYGTLPKPVQSSPQPIVIYAGAPGALPMSAPPAPPTESPALPGILGPRQPGNEGR